MAWTAPRTYVTDEVITAALFNSDHRDNLLALDQHGHGGSSGDGSGTLGNLVKETFIDATAPAAPGAGKTVIYSVSGSLHQRAGAAGADAKISVAADLHTENHASRHQPAGADTMAVDAATGTGSLRTLGTGAQQAAAGDHAHAFSEGVNSNGVGSKMVLSSGGTTITAGNNNSQSISPTAATNERICGAVVLSTIDGSSDDTLELIIDGTTISTTTNLTTSAAHEFVIAGSKVVASGSRTISNKVTAPTSSIGVTQTVIAVGVKT